MCIWLIIICCPTHNTGGHSTCNNLLECIYDWTLAVQDNKSVIVAYIDFSRALDTVSHQKLLAKLYAYGIRGEVLLWLDCYLTNVRTRPEWAIVYHHT